MSDLSITAPARLATRLVFFTAGFAMGCSAPLFPFIKDNVGADKAQFGLLLLCIGLGAVTAMPITGGIAARSGARRVVSLGGVGLVVFMLLLTVANSIATVAVVVFFLLEGAVLDWGALLMIDQKLLTAENAGIGFIFFSVAMVIARFSGDWLCGRARGPARRFLAAGGFIACGASYGKGHFGPFRQPRLNHRCGFTLVAKLLGTLSGCGRGYI